MLLINLLNKKCLAKNIKSENADFIKFMGREIRPQSERESRADINTKLFLEGTI